MKKVLTVLLIAVLAAGFVFADVSGYAQMDFKYNTKDGKFGFVPETALNIKYALGETKTVAGEGDVYATVEADAQLYLQNHLANYDVLTENEKAYNFGLGLDVTGKIVGKNFVVTLKTANSNPVDLAKSAIDTYNGIVYDVWDKEILQAWAVKPVSLKGGFSDKDKRYGLAVDAFGAKVGVDLYKASKDKNAEYEIYGLTPEFVYDGFKAQAGFTVTDIEETKGQISAKVGYEYDLFATNVASDVVLTKGKNAAFDLAANVKYDFVNADVYYVSAASLAKAIGYGKDTTYANYEKYMSAKVSADFSTFDVPVTVAVTAKNLLNGEDGTDGSKNGTNNQSARNFKFEAKYTGVVTADAWVKFCAAKEAKKVVEYSASVDYAFQNYCVFNVGIYGKSTKATDAKTWKNQFMPTISATSKTLVPGAELALGWYSNTSDAYFSTKDSSILSDSKDFGQIRARVKIAF